jgi:hypothetical protein
MLPAQCDAHSCINRRSNAHSLYGAGISDISANLFSVPASREVTHANCRPAEFGHQLGKVPIRAGSALTLLHCKNIQEGLRGDSFQAIEADLAAHALQPQAPWVYGLGGFGRGGLHLFQK